jgi:hypothetical protein
MFFTITLQTLCDSIRTSILRTDFFCALAQILCVSTSIENLVNFFFKLNIYGTFNNKNIIKNKIGEVGISQLNYRVF